MLILLPKGLASDCSNFTRSTRGQATKISSKLKCTSIFPHQNCTTNSVVNPDTQAARQRVHAAHIRVAVCPRLL